MAPEPSNQPPPTSLDTIDTQLKAAVQNLYSLIVQASDHFGTATESAMKREIQALVQHLAALSRSAAHLPIAVPPEVIEYIEQARNPDIYTREFLEVVQRRNQELKGRSEGFKRLRDLLAQGIEERYPELRGEVRRVVESTGGNVKVEQ